jgi:hypothetical protein
MEEARSLHSSHGIVCRFRHAHKLRPAHAFAALLASRLAALLATLLE